jgi:hypothetical protein
MHTLFIASSKVLRQVVVFLVITTQPALVSNAQEIPSSSKSSKVLNLVELCPKREPITRKQVRVLTRSSEDYAEENQTQGNSFPGKENSGIVKSRTTDNLFWIHNDSGDEPKIYPIRANGEDYKVTRYAGDLGVTIAGAINVDWEDITVDDLGNVIVSDLGNNRNDRRDLVFYIIPEPNPSAGRSTFIKRYFVRYPEQTSFPAPKENFNFDCEGVFTINNVIYCFSKNRSDSLSTLYRLDNPEEGKQNVLTSLETINVGGQVVGADASADGKKLVLISYKSIWLFERNSLEESFFTGTIHYAPYEAEQCESVCFADDQTLKMIDEVTGILFDVNIADLTKIR